VVDLKFAVDGIYDQELQIQNRTEINKFLGWIEPELRSWRRSKRCEFRIAALEAGQS
jgi:hypothetical protein